MSFVRRGMGRRTYAATLPFSVFLAASLVACGGDSTNTLLSGGAAGWGAGDPGTGRPGGSSPAPGGGAAEAGASTGSSGGTTSSTSSSSSSGAAGSSGGSGGFGSSGASTSSGGLGGSSSSGSGGFVGSSGSGGSGGAALDASADADPDAFTDDSSAPTGGPLTFTLIDTSITNIVNGSPVAGFDPIAPGTTIDVAVVGSQLSVRANTTPPLVGSVAFTLDNSVHHTEDIAPYMLCSDDTMGRINNCHISLGHHVLTAAVFSQADQGGTAGPTATIDFTLVDSTRDAGSE
jgi:hypothetical protein